MKVLVIAVLLFWIVSGVFAYGLAKNNIKIFLLRRGALNRHGWLAEIWPWFCGICGPMGFWLEYQFTFDGDPKFFDLCYRMPKALCRK